MSKKDGRTDKDDDTDSLNYKDSGVDIDAGAELVKRIAKMAPGIGGFGGLFPLGIYIYGKLQNFHLNVETFGLLMNECV